MRKTALFFFGLVVAALVALGLVILSTASEANGVRLHSDPWFFMKRQFMYLGAGILVAVGTALFDYRKWREHWSLAAVFYCVVFVLLFAVFAFRPINGSYRWIAVGPVNLQPSEFAKLAIVIVTAVWLDRAGWRVELFARGALWPAVFIAALAPTGSPQWPDSLQSRAHMRHTCSRVPSQLPLLLWGSWPAATSFPKVSCFSNSIPLPVLLFQAFPHLPEPRALQSAPMSEP